MIFSLPVIKNLLQDSVSQRLELIEAYSLLPKTLCERNTLCCSMLPEMTLVEALAVTRRLLDMDREIRNHLFKRIVGYYFLNPVEITSCPFLEGQDCLIYNDRFFGCRAYGLWSPQHYEKLSASGQEAKKNLQKQWENMGVMLPKAVVEFYVPYCEQVKTADGTKIEDEMLFEVSERIERLSESFSQWHHVFCQRYFYDMSFFLTSLAFGFTPAIQMKFTVVRDLVATGSKTRIETILKELPDLLSEMI